MTEGHPDKIADQISDGVLDAVLRDDPYGRVACETLVNTGLVVVSGEISTDTYVDIQEIARETIRKIGYNDADLGFDADTCAVINAIDKQSPDIAQGVDEAYETRTRPGRRGRARRRRRRRPGDDVRLRDARDGRADAAADLARAQARQAPGGRPQGRGRSPYLRPDGKTQVTVRYLDGRPVEIEKILISTQHARGRRRRVADQARPVGARRAADPAGASCTTRRSCCKNFLVNPTGRFVIGGPVGDCGLTGPQDHRRHLRRHGPPRRRRVLRQGPVEGRPLGRLRRPLRGQERRRRRPRRPRRGAGRLRDRRRAPGVGDGRDVRHREDRPRRRSHALVDEHFDLRPGAFREDLDLHRPIYQKTAAYGHFGREDHDFTWEKTDKADALRQAAGLGAAGATV